MVQQSVNNSKLYHIKIKITKPYCANCILCGILAKPVNELVGVNPNAAQTDPPPRPGTGRIPIAAMPPGQLCFLIL